MDATMSGFEFGIDIDPDLLPNFLFEKWMQFARCRRT